MVSEILNMVLIIHIIICLNPCSSGRWSRRHLLSQLKVLLLTVLILVLVEDGLGDAETNPKGMGDES